MFTRYRSLTSMLALAVGVAALTAACGSGGGGQARRIDVRASEFSFTPATVTLTAGTRYRLVFKNDGKTLHDWTISSIPAQDVAEQGSGGHDMGATTMGERGMPAGNAMLHVSAEGGKSGELTFTPTQAGEYEYECTVPGHRELGMRGRLVVQA
jgi:uncharacterized cupredoxin-like copper-binding protein